MDSAASQNGDRIFYPLFGVCIALSGLAQGCSRREHAQVTHVHETQSEGDAQVGRDGDMEAHDVPQPLEDAARTQSENPELDGGSASGREHDDVDATGIDCEATCVAKAPCHVAHCERGECLEQPAPDGVSCGIEHVCTLGECVLRTGCGDGYREASEACDDGNAREDDACTNLCQPRTVDVLGVDPALTAEPGALGVDDFGRLLLVALSQNSKDAILWAQALDPRGVPVAGATELAVMPRGFEPEPSVAGGREGWLVSFTAPDDGSSTGVRLVRMNQDGSVGDARWLSEASLGEQRGARLLREGSVVRAVWLSREDASESRTRIATLDLGLDGAARTVERTIQRIDNTVQGLTVAALGEHALLAWAEAAATPGAAPAVRALRMLAGEAKDPKPFTVSQADGYAPLAMMSTPSEALVLYGSRRDDAEGDLFTRVVPMGGENLAAPLALSAAPGIAEQGASAAVFAQGGILFAYERDLAADQRKLVIAARDASLFPALETLFAEDAQRSRRSPVLATARGGVALAFAEAVEPTVSRVRLVFVTQTEALPR